jgi:hypothetical protein
MHTKASNTKESVLAVVLLLLIFFLFTRAKYYVSAAVLLIVISLLSEGFSRLLAIAWRKVTHVLGMISSTILFSVLFYCIFFPVGFLIRSFRRSSYSPMAPGATSTFETRGKTFSAADLEQPF